MRYLRVAVLLAVAGVMVATSFGGCAARSPALDEVRPETRERMKLVMAKIGRYYELLEASVVKGNLSQAPMPAEAIAALGTHLAPHRDPGMPAEYVALQAQFDEAARELAAAARVKSLQEVSQLFTELRQTCRGCHGAFRVTLHEPYRELGFTAKHAD